MKDKHALNQPMVSSLRTLVVATVLAGGWNSAIADTGIPRGNDVSTSVTQQQDRITVSGQVTDEEGEPLVGVTVTVLGENRGTVTDVEGHYTISVKEGDRLRFSYLGMVEMDIRAGADTKRLNVTMKSSTTQLGDVVVTGYQTLSKERVTGSYAVVTPNMMKDKLNTNILGRIEGLVAGMNKINSNGGTGDIVLRGITSYAETTQPLYVVDGMPFEGDIKTINPSDVQNITVLKDAAASSIYGARAANGVVVITTKSGSAGKMSVSYNGSVQFSSKPHLKDLKQLSSSELIDLQIEGFNLYHAPYEDASANPRRRMNPITRLLYEHEAGNLTDNQLTSALQTYRDADNRKQIEKEFTRVGIVQQHNVSISGGSNVNRYMASLNYTGTYGRQRFTKDESIGFLLKDDVNLTKWLTMNFGASGTFTSTSNDTGAGTYMSLVDDYPSYYLLRNAAGESIALPRTKSDYELQRLQSIGLKDERYNPIANRPLERTKTSDHYYRLFAGLKFDIMEGLNFNVNYVVENTYLTTDEHFAHNSYTVLNMINDAAAYDADEGTLTLNVPEGGQLGTTTQRSYAYTLRAQVNFDRSFGKHDITALAGAERRLSRTKQTVAYYMGYDENSLSFKPIDPFSLSYLTGTQSLYGYFDWTYTEHNYFEEVENRYVSFYGNASYEYDNRYAVTGSIRVDQSNLFGTDPKYQYRPLWSVGGSWRVANEAFMKDISWLDRLTLRLTYGIGGNVPKTAGPYMTLTSLEYNDWMNDFYTSIAYPANKRLRWEKTATTNFGVDFSVLGSRLGGSIDIYHKRTTDLLGDRTIDPTLGMETMTLNYGIMTNTGVELSLQSTNIATKNFTWGTNFVFSYNKNKLVDFNGTAESVFYYTAYDVAAEGRPLNSMYSYRYAGLSAEDGHPLFYNKEGEKVDDVSEIADLVYSGTKTPKFNASLSNTFTLGDFDLSLMFVYYGGHVLRTEATPYMLSGPTVNLSRKAMNHWRQPGDELIAGMGPAMDRTKDYLDQHRWYTADAQVKKADYIKLRSLSLGYNVPRKWLKKWGLQSATVTCEINDLWWWAANGDIDPETYSTFGYGWGTMSLPTPTTYTLGLSINF